MTTGVREPSTISSPRPELPLSFVPVESKLQPPRRRPGFVERTDLVERLSATLAPPVIAVIAPPGYGKSSLLAQWARSKPSRVAWVSLDEHDNDPFLLMAYVAVSIHRVQPLDPTIFRALESMQPGISVVNQLIEGIAALPRRVDLAIDHAEALTNGGSLDVLGQLAARWPGGAQLAIGSRTSRPVPLEVLGARGQVVAVGPDDLAMGQLEAAALFAGMDLDVPPADVERIVAATEGWPIGLYLAGRAWRAGAPIGGGRFSSGRDEPLVAKYLRSELLDQVSPADARFLMDCSVLDTMSGPLCDALLGRDGSGAVLERLEDQNLLVVPLDARGEWFRFHHLFRGLLYTELVERDPERVPELHGRAASWYEGHDQAEAAVAHAMAAGDADRPARLVLDLMQPLWARGRVQTVLSWMEWFEERDLVDQHPEVAVHGAMIFALMGRAADAERWADAAERQPATGTLADGSTMESWLAYLRALRCRDGVVAMRRDAQASWNGLSATSPYRATMLHTEGLSHLLDGDLDRAQSLLVRAFDAATRAGAAPLASMVLAEQCAIAAAADDWVAIESLVGRALALVTEGHFEDYWTSALVYAWAGRDALHRHDPTLARDHLARATRLRPLLSYALPVVSTMALLELAHVCLGLADPAGALAAVQQAQEIMAERPDLGTLPSQARQLVASIGPPSAGGRGASSLTAAELRLLPFLSTHLSLGEISERLYVSRNTVKSQAISIYRKLGVTSRSGAMQRIEELGLGHSPPG